jgi:cell wall-associated NlpC family hydrolase
MPEYHILRIGFVSLLVLTGQGYATTAPSRATSPAGDGGDPVPLADVRPEDVLFFELDGRKVSHVGTYAGAGNFIHAPSSGKSVSYASLRSAFWSSRLTGAGRFD